MATPQGPLPQPNFAWTGKGGLPVQAFSLYMAKLDAAVKALVSGFVGTPVQLTNAVNDAAAKAAGVEVGQLYRNGSIVQVRVT
jgi:hypothetical protein